MKSQMNFEEKNIINEILFNRNKIYMRTTSHKVGFNEAIYENL